MGIPRKSNPEAQKEFIKYYEQLKNNLSGSEVILFMDAVHPTQNTKFSCGWMKKGVNQAIPRAASRTRLNAVGAINLKDIGHGIFNRYDTTILRTPLYNNFVLDNFTKSPKTKYFC